MAFGRGWPSSSVSRPLVRSSEVKRPPRWLSLVERALFNDTALIEEQHLIGIANRGKAVGDDEGRAVHSQRVHGGLNPCFRFHVQRAGCLVKDQDGSVLQDSTRNGDTLALATGQTVAAFTHLGQVAGDTAVDEIRRSSSRCCFHDLRVGRRSRDQGGCFRGWSGSEGQHPGTPWRWSF